MAEQGAAPALVPRKHKSGTPRVAVRPNYVGLPVTAARGKDERGESRVIGRVMSSLSDPGSTAPGREIAAVERRTVRVRRSGRPRRKAWTSRALLGAPLPHVCEGEGLKAHPAPFKK